MPRLCQAWDVPSLQDVLFWLSQPIRGFKNCDTTLCLKVFDMQRYFCGITTGYRIRLEVIAATGLPLEVFVWQRKPILTEQFGYRDEFSCPASVADLEEYPPDDPDPAPGAPPFFRRSFTDLIFRNSELAADGLRILLCGLKTLVESVCLNAELVEVGDVTIGNGDCHFSSSSSSSSSSG
jgi:hypothetical protein